MFYYTITRRTNNLYVTRTGRTTVSGKAKTLGAVKRIANNVIRNKTKGAQKTLSVYGPVFYMVIRDADRKVIGKYKVIEDNTGMPQGIPTGVIKDALGIA